MKVIVAGSRQFNDYELLEHTVDSLGLDISEIVSGHANGADKLGERYARSRGIKLMVFPAEWDKYGKGAGIIRNGRMAEYGDYLVAFDMGTPGTKNMIHTMLKLGKPVHIVNV